MELSLKASVFCGLLLYLAHTVSCQGGGVAIGMGGGQFGEVPSTFRTMAPTYPTEASANAGAIIKGPGGGSDTLDARSNTGGPSPNVAGISTGVETTGQSSSPGGTEPISGLDVQIDPFTGTEFTLQNEPYTPLGSVGHLVKVPTNRNDEQGTKVGGNASNAFDDVVVKSVETTQNQPKTSPPEGVAPFLQAGVAGFNPGSGAADEIAALQSATNKIKPVDMSNFIPPPYNPVSVPTSSGVNSGDLATNVIPSISSSNQVTPVDVPEIPNPDFRIMKDISINNAQKDFKVGKPQGERSLREMFSSPEPVAKSKVPTGANERSASATGTSAAGLNSATETDIAVNTNNVPGGDNVKDVAVNPNDMLPPAAPIHGNAYNQTEEPHLQDLTAEGIYPFEGSSIARDATLTESTRIIQDMNEAIATHNTTEVLHLENTMGGTKDVPPFKGPNAGSMSGNNAQAMMGNNVDPTMGNNVDPTLGNNVDPMMGNNVDPMMGNNVDPMMGNNVDPMMGNNVDPMVGYNADQMMGNNVDPPMGNNVDPMMGNNVDPTMGNNEDPTMGNNVDPMMGNNLDPMMGNNVDPMMGNNVDPTMGNNVDPMMGNNVDPMVGNNADQIMGNDAGLAIGNNADQMVGNNLDPMVGNNAEPVTGNDGGPMMGNNGGPITNLVGVEIPQTSVTNNQDPSSAKKLDMTKSQSKNEMPGSFVIGAGMPNAQVIQTGNAPDPTTENINTGGGVSLGGSSPDMSGISLPKTFMTTSQKGSINIKPDNKPRSRDMSNMVPPPFTPIDNVPTNPANNMPRLIPDVTANNAANNAQVLPDVSHNQVFNKPSNNFEMFSPSIKERVIPSNNQELQIIAKTLIPSQLPVNQGSNMLETFASEAAQQHASVVDVNNQPIVHNFNAGPDFHKSIMMPTNNVLDQNTNNAKGFVNSQIPGSDQQIINVKPGWITNMFSGTGNDNHQQPTVGQSPMNVPMSEVKIQGNPADPYPKTQLVVQPSGNNPPNAPGLPTFNIVTNLGNSPNHGAVQIIPLHNKPVVSAPVDHVFKLGAHRVIDTVPSGQPARGNFADYLTQNMIGTADTKPLVSNSNAKFNNIQVQEMSPNSVESQLRKLMVMQESQLAQMAQKSARGSGSVIFEAPGMSDGRSIPVQEQFNHQPNIVSITAESNVPVADVKPDMVQQPVAGGMKTVANINPSKNRNDLSFQFGSQGSMQNSQSNQQNMFLSTDPVFGQSATDAFITHDQPTSVFGNGAVHNQANKAAATQPHSNTNTLDTFASGLRIGQPVASVADIQPAAINSRGLVLPLDLQPDANIHASGQQSNIDMFGTGQNTNVNTPTSGQQTNINMQPMGSNANTNQLATGTRQAVFGGTSANIDLQQLANAGGNPTPMIINSGNEYPITNGLPTGVPLQAANPERCFYEADPTSPLHFIMRQNSVIHRLRCALGTAFDPISCECSRRIVDTGACLEVHMDFNHGVVEDSSRNRLPIGNQNVEITNKSTPLSGIALFNSNSKLTIWRYQNYDFRDDVMLKVQFRPGQAPGDRYQPLIGNCDGSIEGPSIAIIYDSKLKEVILVLKTINSTKKELSFPINALEWNDVTYIYDGREFIGIVNGVRRYVSRVNPRLLGIIGGDIKSVPARGLIEIRDAGIILGHCPRYGYYNGAMVDIQIYTCIPKDFRLE